MKKGINLLVKQQKYLNLEKAFNNLKFLVVGLFVIFIGSNLLLFFLLNRQKDTIEKLTLNKKELLDYLFQHTQVEAKFVYFRNKERQVSDILKQDVNFYPYYELLTNNLASVPQAILETVTIDKLKATTFIVSFPDYSSMLVFFKIAESDTFLKNFNRLVLSQFTNTIGAGQRYQLIFKGSFIPLNEN